MGKVAYVGNVHYAKGIYIGVIMDHATDGKNDGESGCGIVRRQSLMAAIVTFQHQRAPNGDPHCY